MYKFALGTAVASLALVGAAAAENNPAPTAKTLDGAWTVVSYEKDGKAQADANGGRLIAVRVHPQTHSLQGSPGSSSRGSVELTELRDRQRADLERDVVDVLGADHGAEVRVVHGSKRRCLINESHEADVLVIDAPRAPSMSPLLAQRIVYAATLPFVGLVTTYVYLDARTRLELEPVDRRSELPAEIELAVTPTTG